MDIDHADRVGQAVTIVAAYVGRHHVTIAELPALLSCVHDAIGKLHAGAPDANGIVKPTREQIDASVKRDGLVSFIDGKSYRGLRRHLKGHGLTPDAYRERYGLPSGYPMTCSDYSEQRSALAKGIGLGKRRTRDSHAVN